MTGREPLQLLWEVKLLQIAFKQLFGVTFQPLNSWVKSYLSSGIEDLETQPSQGRKPIFNKIQDAEKVKKRRSKRNVSVSS